MSIHINHDLPINRNQGMTRTQKDKDNGKVENNTGESNNSSITNKETHKEGNAALGSFLNETENDWTKKTVTTANGDKRDEYYDSNNTLRETVTTQPNGEVQTNKYDENGNLEQSINSAPYGAGQKEEVNIYDSEGNISSVQSTIYDGNGIKAMEYISGADNKQTLKYYDTNGNVTKTTVTEIKPNGVTVETTTNPDGSGVQRCIKDGKVTMEVPLSANTSETIGSKLQGLLDNMVNDNLVAAGEDLSFYSGDGGFGEVLSLQIRLENGEFNDTKGVFDFGKFIIAAENIGLIFNEDGTNTFILNEDGKPSKEITMDGDNVVSRAEYKYKEDGSLLEKITTKISDSDNYVESALPGNGELKVEKETTKLDNGTVVSVQKEYDEETGKTYYIETVVDKNGNVTDNIYSEDTYEHKDNSMDENFDNLVAGLDNTPQGEQPQVVEVHYGIKNEDEIPEEWQPGTVISNNNDNIIDSGIENHLDELKNAKDLNEAMDKLEKQKLNELLEIYNKDEYTINVRIDYISGNLDWDVTPKTKENSEPRNVEPPTNTTLADNTMPDASDINIPTQPVTDSTKGQQEIDLAGVNIPEGFSSDNGDKYVKNQDGSVTFTINNENGKPSKEITMDGDKVVSSTEYKYKEDGSLSEKVTTKPFDDGNYVPSELPKDGTLKVEKETVQTEDGTVSIQKEYDKDGNVYIIRTELDKNGELISQTQEKIPAQSQDNVYSLDEIKDALNKEIESLLWSANQDGYGPNVQSVDNVTLNKINDILGKLYSGEYDGENNIENLANDLIAIGKNPADFGIVTNTAGMTPPIAIAPEPDATSDFAIAGVTIPEGFSLKDGDYKINDDGTVTFTIKQDGKPSKEVTMNGNDVVSTVEYKYNDDGTLAEKVSTKISDSENYKPSELPENGKLKVERETHKTPDGSVIVEKKYDEDGNLASVTTTKKDKDGNITDEKTHNYKSPKDKVDVPDAFSVRLTNNPTDISNINIPQLNTGVDANVFLKEVDDLISWAKNGNSSLATALEDWKNNGCEGNFHWQASDENSNNKNNNRPSTSTTNNYNPHSTNLFQGNVDNYQGGLGYQNIDEYGNGQWVGHNDWTFAPGMNTIPIITNRPGGAAVTHY